LRTLGGGTFSKVELVEAQDSQQVQMAALKVVDLQPKDIDPARLLTTIQREIELLQTVRHPLIVSLLGHRMMQDRALLLLPYHPGGDLYTLAAEHREAMTNVSLVKRIMAELVVAVSHLHERNIVHRDLKLENVLIRHKQESILEHLAQGTAFESPLTALTDFGLARFIDPEEPDLVTRCGSEDYAAPEIIMGQRYDGRQTDAWALGALFYSLLEGRLPFDVIPGLEHRMKGKVLHRICRIEWRWVTLRQPGEYDAAWDGAKRIVSNLLRSRTKRWSVAMLLEDEW
ncbi:kinase-like domain-containing protein, partial [Protomyces lactucae-debilis]